MNCGRLMCLLLSSIYQKRSSSILAKLLSELLWPAGAKRRESSDIHQLSRVIIPSWRFSSWPITYISLISSRFRPIRIDKRPEFTRQSQLLLNSGLSVKNNHREERTGRDVM